VTDLSTDDFFAELDAEIAAAVKASSLKTNIEAERRKSLNTRLDSATRLAAKANFLEAQALIDAELWTATALVAMFSEQTCDGCGSTHRIFLHYMEKQHQHRKPTNKRWVRTTALTSPLPRETTVIPTITHVCADCCSEHGFHFSGATMTIRETVAPSATYFQEDINAQ